VPLRKKGDYLLFAAPADIAMGTDKKRAASETDAAGKTAIAAVREVSWEAPPLLDQYQQFLYLIRGSLPCQ
jgi:hypothetical protein